MKGLSIRLRHRCTQFQTIMVSLLRPIKRETRLALSWVSIREGIALSSLWFKNRPCPCSLHRRNITEDNRNWMNFTFLFFYIWTIDEKNFLLITLLSLLFARSEKHMLPESNRIISSNFRNDKTAFFSAFWSKSRRKNSKRYRRDGSCRRRTKYGVKRRGENAGGWPGEPRTFWAA